VTLSDAQIRRYARHILLPDVGGVGQARLLSSAVVVEVGAERAAEVAALAYLAAAGVGRLLLSGDPDGAVTAPEQAAGILYAADDLGAARLDALRRRIAAINPDVTVERWRGEPGAAPLAAPAGLDAPARASGDGACAAALVAGGAAAVQTLAALVSP
jgi:molybdopterin-synthase adenylyltransferase